MYTVYLLLGRCMTVLLLPSSAQIAENNLVQCDVSNHTHQCYPADVVCVLQHCQERCKALFCYECDNNLCLLCSAEIHHGKRTLRYERFLPMLRL